MYYDAIMATITSRIPRPLPSGNRLRRHVHPSRKWAMEGQINLLGGPKLRRLRSPQDELPLGERAMDQDRGCHVSRAHIAKHSRPGAAVFAGARADEHRGSRQRRIGCCKGRPQQQPTSQMGMRAEESTSGGIDVHRSAYARRDRNRYAKRLHRRQKLGAT